jgi:glycosyltransferase involved in cell wall biosynthesis
MASQPTPDTVSVILPYFNRSDTLTEAARSVLGQTHSDLLLYLINDGSTDESRDVVELVDDPRVRHIALDRNQGVAHARNVGLDVAKTTLVSFMDSDDVWLPEKLEMQLKFLRAAQVADRSIAATGCGWRVSGTTAQPKIFWPGPFSRIDVHDRVAGLRTPMLLVDRAVAAQSARFDESLPALLDRDFVMSCLANGSKVVVLPAVLAEVRRGRKDHVATSQRAAQAYERLMRKYEHDLDEHPTLRAWYSFRAAREYLVHRDLRHALSHLPAALADQRTSRLANLFFGAVAGHRGFSVAQRLLPGRDAGSAVQADRAAGDPKRSGQISSTSEH